MAEFVARDNKVYQEPEAHGSGVKMGFVACETNDKDNAVVIARCLNAYDVMLDALVTIRRTSKDEVRNTAVWALDQIENMGGNVPEDF